MGVGWGGETIWGREGALVWVAHVRLGLGQVPHLLHEFAREDCVALVDPSRDLLVALPRDVLDQRPPRDGGIRGASPDRFIVSTFEPADDRTHLSDVSGAAFRHPAMHVDYAATAKQLGRPRHRDAMVPVGSGRDRDGFRDVSVISSDDFLCQDVTA